MSGSRILWTNSGSCTVQWVRTERHSSKGDSEGKEEKKADNPDKTSVNGFSK